MNTGRTVFSQLINHLPNKAFDKCVARYRGDYYLKSFSCWDQYLAMAFAQLSYRESLRDIEVCLCSMRRKLYPDRSAQAKRSRVRRPGLEVRCLGDWPLPQRVFRDR